MVVVAYVIIFTIGIVIDVVKDVQHQSSVDLGADVPNGPRDIIVYAYSVPGAGEGQDCGN